jgi:2-polyprenyl-3-methyl-5-hydroxy-6-metoxy-1,4-benzoquinol methylase/uncharacterized protein YbaR (Trm112 family)
MAESWAEAWLREHLVCPRDQQSLRTDRERLVCPQGHEYPVVDGVPVMLLDDVAQTIGVAADSLREARKQPPPDPWFVDAIPCNPRERALIRQQIATFRPGTVDPVVQSVLNATNGNLYRSLLGKLREYPIPDIRLPAANGDTLLDIGCNWGRWCVAASRKGYRVIGIDPALGSIMAAKRMCQQLGVTPGFVVGDARYLPFAGHSFDRVFSYSVLQHFSKENARQALTEVARVLRPGGESLIQMANALGVRSLQHQVMRGFRSPRNFEVRYWTPGELRRCFNEVIGKSRLSVDGYFGLGIQLSDLNVMPAKYRAVIRTSEVLRRISEKIPAMAWAADSLYIHSLRA